MAGTKHITNTLIDTGADLLYKNRSVLTSLALGNVIWVSASGGEDATALIGRIDRPFRTINAALAVMIVNVNYHLIVLPGTYNEVVVAPAIARGTIELMPNVYIFYNGTDDRYTMTLNGNIHLTANIRGKSSVERLGIGAGGAIDANFATLANLTVRSSGTGHAVYRSHMVAHCYIASTGGIGWRNSDWQPAYIHHSVITSTVSDAVYHHASQLDVESCFFYGQGCGIQMFNTGGIKCRNSTVIGVTGYGYTGYNWPHPSLVEHSFFKGYIVGFTNLTNGTDAIPHIYKDSIFITDPANTTATYSASLHLSVSQNLIGNKPFYIQSPHLTQNVAVVEAIATVKANWNYRNATDIYYAL